jgi:magnesium and cobalt transporter
MMEGVLQVAEMQVRDIMIPRSKMVVVDQDATLEDIMPILTRSAHSRFPVVGDNQDEVVGILLAKDLLSYFVNDNAPTFNVRDNLRPAVLIPESKRLNVLLKEFRASRNHMALVVNEYGGIDGLVTIEDVLEQIVGDIVDEHDNDENFYIHKHSESRYTIKALTPIEEFNEVFDTQLSDEEYDTIGGMLVRRFGHLPKRGETILIEELPGLPAGLGLHFKVLHADGRRLHLLQLTMQHIDAGAAGE